MTGASLFSLAILILSRAVLALISGEDARRWKPQIEALLREAERQERRP